MNTGLSRLSVVIPAYNEELRLPAFLGDVRDYLDGSDLSDYEVIIVDDGSRDATAELVRRRVAEWSRLRLLQLPANRGKGAAVRLGVLASRCPLVLYADADGATPIDQERALRRAILEGADLAAASRLVRGTSCERTVERDAHRAFLGRAYAAVARLTVRTSVLDPQCGFKMFRRDVSELLFRVSREDGYLLDLEILGLAYRIGLRTAEVGVEWREVAGSKMNLLRDGPRMAIGLMRVRFEVAAAARAIGGEGVSLRDAFTDKG